MAVFRVNRNKNYTHMANYHFYDKSLSWKAKGILSNMLSLPDDWDYSLAGLVTLANDGIASTRAAIKELEEHGYLIRRPIREDGKIADWEYLIFEKPNEQDADFLLLENQQVEKPVVGKPLVENPTQLNTNQLTTKESNTNPIKDTIPSGEVPPPQPKIDYQQIIDLFNGICKSLPKVRALTDARKAAIKSRLRKYTVDDFRTVFENAERSSFLKGADGGWKASFDWLIKEANMVKVMEGNYADKGNRYGGRKEKVPGWLGFEPGEAELESIRRTLNESPEAQAERDQLAKELQAFGRKVGI